MAISLNLSMLELILSQWTKGTAPISNFFFRLTKLIKRLNPDVVHTHLGAILYNILSPFLFRNIKFFHTIHNEAKKEAETGGKISALARKVLFRLGLTIPITISKESQNSFIKYYGIRCRQNSF